MLPMLVHAWMHICSVSLSMHASSTSLSVRALSLLYSASHADMQGPGPDQSRQYISALAILFVAIFIGVPIWWKTTEVYRCPLPYKEISELAHQQVNVMAAVPNAIYQVCWEHLSSFSSSSSCTWPLTFSRCLHRLCSRSLLLLWVRERDSCWRGLWPRCSKNSMETQQQVQIGLSSSLSFHWLFHGMSWPSLSLSLSLQLCQETLRSKFALMSSC